MKQSGRGAIGSALALGARGCQFESGRPDQIFFHFSQRSSSMVLARFILLFLFLASFVQAEDLSVTFAKNNEIEQQIAVWTDQYLTQMSPSQLQLTANFVYLLYACNLLEYAVHIRIPAIVNQIQHIEQKLRSNHDAINELATVQILATQLKHTSHIRQLMYATFAHAQEYFACTQEDLDDNTHAQEFNLIDNALEFLQLHGQHMLRLHADTHEEQLNKDIAELGNTLGQLKQFSPVAASMCRGLHDNAISFDVEPENKNLAKIDTASHLCIKIDKQIWHIIDSTNQLYNHLIQLTGVGKNLYAAYYRAVYLFLQTHHIDKHYRYVMFCPQGLLVPEFRTELLASPERIVENVIKLDHINNQNTKRSSNA